MFLQRTMVGEQVPELSDFKSPPRRPLEREQLAADNEPIGSGGQGAVYRVNLSQDIPVDQVAIKEPIADAETIPVGDIQTFLDEAETWQTVDQREREKQRWEDSEHIVGVIDTGDSLPWIAMEYMDGGGLDDRLESNPNGLPVDEALWVGECICRGVELAHSYGIAHLDLKPANILFRETNPSQWDVPKIADWGLARILAKQSGTMEGISVQYAAPEQFEPEEFGEPDMLTDVYQVGAIVYSMLTGEPLYTGNQLSVVHDVVYGDDPAPPSDIRNDLSSDVDNIVSRAIATDKENRYQTIKRFERELQSIRAGESTSANISTVEAKHSEPSENATDHTVSSVPERNNDSKHNEAESASYSNQDSNEQPTEDSKTTTDRVTVSSEGRDFSIEVVALSEGREIDRYLKTDISKVEDKMSLSGKKTFEGRIVAFVKVENNGEKVDANTSDFAFETGDGYQYSLAYDEVMGTTSVYIKNKWKSSKWEISHGQIQYWTIISEPIPSNVNLDRLLYENKGEKIEVEFGKLRNTLYENDPMNHIS